MAKFKIEICPQTKEQVEGNEPWNDIWDTDDDPIQAESVEEALEFYSDWVAEMCDCEIEIENCGYYTIYFHDENDSENHNAKCAEFVRAIEITND